nr:unnamed protein product [Callosobruchus analis]
MLGSKMEDGLFDLVVKDIFDHVASKYDKKYLIRERSSRSHTIFRIILESKDADEDGPVQISQLNLVDLAGSERVAQTKAAALGNVIRQLSEGRQQFVNYRDSKLTRLLTQALGGNAKSLIIANITLVAAEETKSTLEFAQRAKNVKNRPEVNILSSRDEAIQQYQTMQHNLETRLKKQAELLAEMERHREECLIEIERLKVEATIVGHFQSGSSAIQLQKPSRRHTIGDYGSSSGKQYKPLKQFSQGGSSRKLYNHILVFLWRG